MGFNLKAVRKNVIYSVWYDASNDDKNQHPSKTYNLFGKNK